MELFLNKIKEQFPLKLNSEHGVEHWNRVSKIGLYLAAQTGADPEVIKYFAYLHDSRREDEYYDSEHGLRAAGYVEDLHRAGFLKLKENQLAQLVYACKYHSKRDAKSMDMTVQTCWDADRLDLYRVGQIPDPKYLYTKIAKDKETADFVLGLWFSEAKSKSV